jgi:hypothetical protein
MSELEPRPVPPSSSRAIVSVVGGTGLVGQALVEALLAHPGVGEVHAFQRRPGEGFVYGPHGARLRVHPTDFESWTREGKGAPRATHPDASPGKEAPVPDQARAPWGRVLFSALGTTRRAAGSREAQYRVDHDYQVEVARRAAAAGARTLVLVSSMGADPAASTFYLRMKGEIEAAVSVLPFRTVHLLRPGILAGEREEFRPAEQAGLLVARLLARLGAPHRFRPAPAPLVARAMVRLGVDEVAPPGGEGEGRRREAGPDPLPRVHIHEPRDLFRLARAPGCTAEGDRPEGAGAGEASG